MKFFLKKFIFILVVSPALVWIFFHPMGVIKEWLRLPTYLKNNLNSLIGNDKLMKVDEERWNAFGPKKEEIISKIYYNKGTVLADDFFTMLTYLSPRLYFQSGDGSSLSPPRAEPIAIPLFLFWVIGIAALIKKGKSKVLLSILLLGLFAYFFGQRNMAYLLPILIIYIIIAHEGIESIKNKNTRKVVYLVLTLYGLFLLGRVFILK